MGKLDQKQKIQVVVLAVLAVGMFGTFIYRMVQITPAAAKQVASTSQTTSGDASKPAGGVKLAGTSAADALIADAPPPTANMRDPFVPGIADDAMVSAYQKSLQPAKPARQDNGDWNKPTVPFVAPLPRPGDLSIPAVRNSDYSVAPLPKPADAVPGPAWTVTGVVGGDDGRMAILRNGDARRMVRTGDMVDDTFRVVDVDANHVTLAHGKSRFTLELGAKPAASSPAMATPQANTPQDLGAPAEGSDTGVPAGTVNPGGSEINPNATIKLPGGLTLPTIHLPAN